MADRTVDSIFTFTHLADALIYEYSAKNLCRNCTDVHKYLILVHLIHQHSSLKLLLLLSFVADQKFQCRVV